MEFDFDKIDYLVEAESFAAHKLAMDLIHRYGDLAKQGNPGHSFVCGHATGANGQPGAVVIVFWKYNIGDINIAFYEATSQLVDWVLIHEWIEERYSGLRTNATNFHHVIHVINESLAVKS